jgi:hypothetical protein
LTRTLKEAFDDGVFSEGHGLLGKVEAFNLCPLLLCPIDVGRKANQLLVDINATNASAAAQGGIENLNH